MSSHTADTQLKLIGKLILEGELQCETGLHIGAGKGSLEIGGADNPVVKDAFGLPVAHVHVDDHANDQAMRKHAQRQMSKIFEAIDARRIVVGPVPPATHNMGTARMSADPRDGVTNRWGQTHEIKNLFVSDGSALSTPGAANPTLTIVALALRQAEFISQQMKAHNI